MFSVPDNANDWLHLVEVIGPNPSAELILLRKSAPPGAPESALTEIDRILRGRLICLRQNIPPGFPAAVLLEIDALLTEAEIPLRPKPMAQPLGTFMAEVRELLNILKQGEQACY